MNRAGSGDRSDKKRIRNHVCHRNQRKPAKTREYRNAFRTLPQGSGIGGCNRPNLSTCTIWSIPGAPDCFACKTLGGKSYGRCAVKDGLTPLLKKIEQDADAIILGSPIYFGTDTGMMRSFLERLMFPYLTYTLPHGTLFPRKILTGFIYTMNIPENLVKEYGYTLHFATNENVLAGLFGHSEHLCAYDTYQFKDYSKVLCTMFDAKKKAERKKTVFPRDCKKAFLMGVRFAQKNPV